MRSLGKMAAVGLLNRRQRTVLEGTILSALGRSESYSWDHAYIVRREAEEALRHLARVTPPPSGRRSRAGALPS
jgi:hypothetical protein